MNKNVTRSFILFLICALLLPSVFACGGNSGKNDDQNTGIQVENNGEVQDDGEKTENDVIEPDLPDMQFDGYEFKVLNTKPDAVTWLLTQVTAEEETGDVFNDAVFRRNRQIEEKYDITIKEIVAVDPGDVKTKATKSVKSGSDDYDLLMSYIGDSLTMAQSGLLLELHSIPYIDLDKPWWDKDVVNDLSIGGKLYGVAGDFCFAHYSAVMPIFFNKQMHRNLGLEDPYQLVRDGEWTLEKFADLSKDASLDLDGNGKWDEKDQYGFMSLNFLVYPSWSCIKLVV